jgi:hypothetical protein
MLHILNLRSLEVLTLKLQLHPCPSSQKNQHLMGLLLRAILLLRAFLLHRAIRQTYVHRPLTCHHLAGLLLLSTGQILACTSLQQAGLTLGHHRPTMLDTNSKEEAVSLSNTVTVGLRLTVVIPE